MSVFTIHSSNSCVSQTSLREFEFGDRNKKQIGFIIEIRDVPFPQKDKVQRPVSACLHRSWPVSTWEFVQFGKMFYNSTSSLPFSFRWNWYPLKITINYSPSLVFFCYCCIYYALLFKFEFYFPFQRWRFLFKWPLFCFETGIKITYKTRLRYI